MEDFVTYDLAIKLKDKGFNWICSHYYRTKCKDLFMVFPSEDWSNAEERINAPTISQVLKWLREEKRLHIAIDVWSKTWGYDIIKLTSGNSLRWTAYREDIKSYEDAALDGIEYVIDNLI